MNLDLDLIFPIRDVASADLMKLKANCLWSAGIIDDGERELVHRRAERFLQRVKANAALWPSALHPSNPAPLNSREGGHKSAHLVLLPRCWS
jgi:hypothetical protein